MAMKCECGGISVTHRYYITEELKDKHGEVYYQSGYTEYRCTRCLTIREKPGILQAALDRFNCKR